MRGPKTSAGSGRWVNIFDEDDPVGMPLKVLNEAYNKVVHKDVLVNSGVYGISHTNYFKHLYLSMPKRIGKVLEAGGLPVDY